MDWPRIIENVITVSPLAALALWLFLQERKERKQITKRLLDTLEVQAEANKAVRHALAKRRGYDDD